MSFAIAAKSRTGEADALRAQARVPGILYGAGITPASLSVSAVELEKLYRNVSESTLVDFTLENASPVKVLLQDVQFDPVKGKIIHVDFRQINMSQELEVAVEIRLIGLAPAVKEFGGSLVQQVESVNVRCLPKDLIDFVEVDVSSLVNFDTAIYSKDLKLPAGVESLDEPETIIAKVAAPMSEEQMKALEEAGTVVDLSKIEVEKKGKDEEAAEAGAAEAVAEAK